MIPEQVACLAWTLSIRLYKLSVWWLWGSLPTAYKHVRTISHLKSKAKKNIPWLHVPVPPSHHPIYLFPFTEKLFFTIQSPEISPAFCLEVSTLNALPRPLTTSRWMNPWAPLSPSYSFLRSIWHRPSPFGKTPALTGLYSAPQTSPQTCSSLSPYSILPTLFKLWICPTCGPRATRGPVGIQLNRFHKLS